MTRHRIAALFLITCLAGVAVTRSQSRVSDAPPAPAQGLADQIKNLESTDPVKRAGAACALGKMGEAALPAIPALVKLLADGTRVEPKLVCYREYFAEPNAEPEFDGLKEPSPGEAAMQTLILFGSPSVSPLIAALTDKQWRVRKNAAWALAQIRDRRAVLPLIDALEDDVWQVRAYAAAALGQQRDSRITEPLIIALYDENAAVRWFAASSLGQTNDHRVVGPLLGALQDRHPRTRAFAAASLGQIRDSRAVLPLIDALKDVNPQVRMYAAAALGQQGDPRARGALTDALKDKRVRFYARVALEQLKP